MASKIIFITGATCSGKSTVKNFLCENITNIQALPLHTNRPKRETDIEGIDYIFNTDEEIKDLIYAEKPFEFTYYKTPHGDWYYCTSKDDIKDDTTYIISASVDTLCRYYKNIFKLPFDVTIIPIYIKTTLNAMEIRYYERSENKDDPEIERRILDDYRKYNDGKYSNILDLIIPEENTFLNLSVTNIDKLLNKILNRVKELI